MERTRNFVGEHWKKATAAVAVGIIGVGAFIGYEKLSEEDQSQEVTGYLSAYDIRNFNVKVSKDGKEIQFRCPNDTVDELSDSFTLKIERKLGDIQSASVVIKEVDTTSYLDADGNIVLNEAQDPAFTTYSLEDTADQESLMTFIDRTPTCAPKVASE